MQTTSVFSIVAPANVNDARVFREQLCQWIEVAIALLDVMDGDCDLEADGDAEPWLGWTSGMGHGNTLDLEEGAHEEIDG